MKPNIGCAFYIGEPDATEVIGLMQIPQGVQPGGYVPVELQMGIGSSVRGKTAWR